MKGLHRETELVHQGGHRASHGDAAGGAQGGHGVDALDLYALFLAEQLDGFGDPWVSVLGQEDPAGGAVFQSPGNLLGPGNLFGGF